MKALALSALSTLFYIHVSAQHSNTVNWITFEQLSDSLTIKPKKVLLFFHTDWCVYCRKMQDEVFTDPIVVEFINTNYYAVSFDAESADSIYFDGHILTNKTSKKKTGQYHQIATLLAHRQGKLTFPTTVLLDERFSIKKRYFSYLSPKKIIQALKD